MTAWEKKRVTMEREEDRERGQPAGWVGCLWKDGGCEWEEEGFELEGEGC